MCTTTPADTESSTLSVLPSSNTSLSRSPGYLPSGLQDSVHTPTYPTKLQTPQSRGWVLNADLVPRRHSSVTDHSLTYSHSHAFHHAKDAGGQLLLYLPGQTITRPVQFAVAAGQSISVLSLQGKASRITKAREAISLNVTTDIFRMG